MTTQRSKPNRGVVSSTTLARYDDKRRPSTAAFTLIELLVVISIIALLASLTVGLSGLAGRKSKESRIRGDLNKLVTAIDGYRAAIGSYPPDNKGRPSVNQLFYELSGTYYTDDQFRIRPEMPKGVRARDITAFFNTPGFGNSVRVGDKLKFTEEFKPGQYKEVALNNLLVEILVVPVKGADTFTFNNSKVPLQIKATDGTMVNPWLYDSSSVTRNNRSGFDLWTEVIIGKNVVRFSNWERDPVAVGPAP